MWSDTGLGGFRKSDKRNGSINMKQSSSKNKVNANKMEFGLILVKRTITSYPSTIQEMLLSYKQGLHVLEIILNFFILY